jgi:DMSO/TMAO reductase YedYZ molybdopterin-dependent catalytic subunit
MMRDIPRREFIINGGAAVTAMALLNASRAFAYPERPGESVVPWLDQPTENPDPVGIQTQLVWENLDSWITPNDEFFSISHFDRPAIDASTWKLEIDGLVKKPVSLTLDDIKARTRQEVAITDSRFSPAGLAMPVGPVHRLRPFFRKPASWKMASRWSSGEPMSARSKSAT